MSTVSIIFGSTMGGTEGVAEQIATAFGVTAVNVASATVADFDTDLVILGSSTWGFGDLQDDWDSQIGMLDSIDLTGKKVAVFGTGDQEGFADSFANALGTLADKAIERGATLIGTIATDGYTFGESTAVRDDKFCGLPIDDNNQSELTADRIATWVEQLKGAL